MCWPITRAVLELAQERSNLEGLVGAFRQYQELQNQLADNRALLAEDDDPELAELAELEIAELAEKSTGLEDEMRRLLLPKDRNDDKNVIVEIRAGAGGNEAGLFAADLLRMYTRWADDHKFKTELMSVSETGVGGIKEAILEVRGNGAFQPVEVRVGRTPGTARTHHGKPGKGTYKYGYCGRVARGRRRGDRNQL